MVGSLNGDTDAEKGYQTGRMNTRNVIGNKPFAAADCLRLRIHVLTEACAEGAAALVRASAAALISLAADISGWMSLLCCELVLERQRLVGRRVNDHVRIGTP